ALCALVMSCAEQDRQQSGQHADCGVTAERVCSIADPSCQQAWWEAIACLRGDSAGLRPQVSFIGNEDAAAILLPVRRPEDSVLSKAQEAAWRGLGLLAETTGVSP